MVNTTMPLHVMLAPLKLAAGQDVFVSREKAGGRSAVPSESRDVMRQSGAGLIEVGTTNRTTSPRTISGRSPNRPP